MRRKYHDRVAACQHQSDARQYHNCVMADVSKPAFATRLARAREDAGLTQEQLAQAVSTDKHQSFISNLESGVRNSSTYIPEIAHALGVDAYWLKTGKGNPHANRYGVAKPTENSYTMRFPADGASGIHHELKELVDVAKHLSDKGLYRLIERANALREQFPKEPAGAKAKRA